MPQNHTLKIQVFSSGLVKTGLRWRFLSAVNGKNIANPGQKFTSRRRLIDNIELVTGGVFLESKNVVARYRIDPVTSVTDSEEIPVTGLGATLKVAAK